MKPPKNKVGHEPASRIELLRSATGMACVQLWARVVLQVVADIDMGLRILRAGPTADLETAAARSARVKDARAAARWLFGPAARHDRTWICGWINIEPGRLQEVVRRTHGSAVDGLLVKRQDFS